MTDGRENYITSTELSGFLNLAQQIVTRARAEAMVETDHLRRGFADSAKTWQRDFAIHQGKLEELTRVLRKCQTFLADLKPGKHICGIDLDNLLAEVDAAIGRATGI